MSSFVAKYTASHALVVGINKYQKAPPLMFATNDGHEIAAVLRDRFAFDADSIVTLTDADATRQRITAEVARLSRDGICGENDRVFFFFAGHGHTVRGRRGDTGFLVPVDGDIDDVSSLIRWDELVRSSELIPAKHMFFIIDACYGGLALSRKGISAGSVRLLKDMLQRYSRQVLTAGKADQTVADGGGVRLGHSIFTSYVLEAFDALGEIGDGISSANKLMSYVYEKVGNDPASNQTPHYGFVDGDGDFVFNPPSILEDVTAGGDVFIQTMPAEEPLERHDEVAKSIKSMLSDRASRIDLEDYVDTLIREAVSFLVSMTRNERDEAFDTRVAIIERVMSPLAVTSILIAKWGDREQLPLLYKILQRIAEIERPREGRTFEIHFSWYSYFFLLYAAGVSAVSQGRFDVLHECLTLEAPIEWRYSRTGDEDGVVLPEAVRSMTSIVDNFKNIPGFERHVTSRSDYIYQRLQILVEDNLYLGKSYQSAFDEFEIFLALTYADIDAGDDLSHVWGPPGRFLWRNRADGERGPYRTLMSKAAQKQNDWPPVKAGFFRGAYSRFASIASEYLKALDTAHF